MTAPDSRDSVEKIIAEMRNPPGRALTHLEYMAWILTWADRLQALARGPQQTSGEDGLVQWLNDAAWACAHIPDELAEQLGLEHDGYATAVPGVSGDVYDRLVQAAETILALRAALREAGRDAERLDWLIENRHLFASCGGQWFAVIGPTEIAKRDTARAAIDAALNGGQDDA